MRIKPIHVLDAATDVYYLVGKMDDSDTEWMRRTGWGSGRNHSTPTLLVKTRAERTAAVISHFSCPEVDIPEHGIDLDHTVLGLVRKVRNLTFDELPDEVDLR